MVEVDSSRDGRLSVLDRRRGEVAELSGITIRLRWGELRRVKEASL
jgi:hypothetical protein